MQYTRTRGIADNAGRIQSLIRILVFLFLAVLLCPIRYFTLSGENVLDSSWLYAVNLAALRGLRFGVDIIWTTGPLAYLFQPLDIGNHLARGVLAQSLVWLVLLCVAADLCFLAATPLGNLVAFTLGGCPRPGGNNAEGCYRTATGCIAHLRIAPKMSNHHDLV